MKHYEARNHVSDKIYSGASRPLDFCMSICEDKMDIDLSHVENEMDIDLEQL